LEIGDRVNAKDGLGIASLSTEFRSPAYAKLAEIYLQDQDPQQALHYTELALDFNRYAVSALETRAIALRKLGDRSRASAVLSELEGQLPLSPFVRFEKGLWDPAQQPGPQVFDRSELPQEVWLELASGYVQRGCRQEALTCLGFAGNYPLPLYWKAYLDAQNGQPFNEPLGKADRLSSLMVFPFRVEMIPVLRWAVSVSDSWKPRYYLALLLNDKGQRDEAYSLVQSLAEQPDAAPFYALRALWSKDDPASAERDLKHALSIDTADWRYPKLLAQHYITQKAYDRALAIAATYGQRHPGSYIMQMLHVKTLLLTKQYAACDALLAKMDIIPFEGATEGRGFYWEAKLMQALEQMEKGQYKKALAFIDAASLWPENLGVGKPYDADIDSRLENWLRYECHSRSKNIAAAQKALDAVLAFKPGIYNTVMNFQPANHLVSAWALEHTGTRQSAMEWINEQQNKFPQLAQLKWVREAFAQREVPETELEDAGIRLLRRLATGQTKKLY
jgi:tetratricopeptide (TPR) repeat protein